MTEEPIEVFFSYSHQDEKFKDELVKHLSILQRQGVISVWHDRMISPGSEWDREIDAHLSSADIILLMVSSDFLYSDYCWGVEIKKALQRHEAGEARVIPVVLRHVDWRDAPLSKLQALPKNAKPIKSWLDQDEAFKNIAEGIRDVAKKLQQVKQQAKKRQVREQAARKAEEAAKEQERLAELERQAKENEAKRQAEEQARREEEEAAEERDRQEQERLAVQQWLAEKRKRREAEERDQQEQERIAALKRQAEEEAKREVEERAQRRAKDLQRNKTALRRRRITLVLCCLLSGMLSESAGAFFARLSSTEQLQFCTKSASSCRAFLLGQAKAVDYYNRAVFKSDRGDRKGAIGDYTNLLLRKPFFPPIIDRSISSSHVFNSDFGGIYYRRATLRSDLGDKKGAIADLQEAADFYQQQGNSEWHQNAVNELKKPQP